MISKPHFIFFILSLIISALVNYGCSESGKSIPIDPYHPAYEFYQIASRGPTDLETCKSYKGKQLYPKDYKIIERMGQGVFDVILNSTGAKYMCVSFAGRSIIVAVESCCWKE